MYHEDYNKLIIKAKSDLATADYNFEGNRYDACILFAHTSVEKTLKSLYLKKHGHILHTHDLTKLAKELLMPDHMVKLCSRLTHPYHSFMNSELNLEFHKEEAEECLTAALEILTFIQKFL